MATTPKNKPVKTTVAPKGKIVASKKKGLGRKQWGIVAAAGVLVLAVAGYFGVQYYQDNQSNAASCISKTYIKGKSGTCVKNIQKLVNDAYKNKSSILGKASALKVTGKYDAATETAVRNIQSHTYVNSSIPVTVNGQVNAQTWAVLCSMSYNDSLLRSAGCRDSKGNTTAAIKKYQPVGLSPTAH